MKSTFVFAYCFLILAQTGVNPLLSQGADKKAVRCLGFHGQSNSLFLREREGRSNGPSERKRQEKTTTDIYP